MIIAFFDGNAFYAALDQVRQARGLTWYDVFRETGIAYATFRKMRLNGRKPNPDTLATFIVWSGLDANVFMKREVEA